MARPQVIMLVWSYFAAVCIDPGQVPPGWLPFENEQVSHTLQLWCPHPNPLCLVLYRHLSPLLSWLALLEDKTTGSLRNEVGTPGSRSSSLRAYVLTGSVRSVGETFEPQGGH